MRKRYKTSDEYIADFPEDVRAHLRSIRRIMRGGAPGAMETISYQLSKGGNPPCTSPPFPDTSAFIPFLRVTRALQTQ